MNLGKSVQVRRRRVAPLHVNLRRDCPKTSAQLDFTFFSRKGRHASKDKASLLGRLLECVACSDLFLGCFGLRGFGFAGVALGVFPAEAFDAAGGVHKLLLPGKERMAGGADFHADGAFMGRAGGKCTAARAMHVDLVVAGMDSCFHDGSYTSIPEFRFYRS